MENEENMEENEYVGEKNEEMKWELWHKITDTHFQETEN